MKMKKKILSVAVLAALGASTAQAVNISKNGTGQVILFPYYTVQGNEETYIQVTNTTNMGKAVKIRFREAYNSREVLDFNIYLSPYDVWTGGVVDSGDGAGIVSADNTCTVPQLSGNTIAFRTTRLQDDSNGAEPALLGKERTREGYVEIIEMGEIHAQGTGVVPAFLDVAPNDGVADFVHDHNGDPQSCNTLLSAWGSTWSGNSNAGILPPGGGLFGALSIINVSTGTQVGVNATALEAVYAVAQHQSTGNLAPTLASGTATSVVILNDGAAINGQAAQVYEDNWGPSGIFAGINAVSATLMARSVINGYSVNPSNEAESAWIVTFPTKWAYVDQSQRVVPGPAVSGPAVAPFTKTFQDAPLARSSWDNKACEAFNLHAWDREEKPNLTDIDFSPSDDITYSLCYEVNVLQFEESSVFDAVNTKRQLTGLPGSKGWMNMDFFGGDNAHVMGNAPGSRNINGNIYEGLPVIGFKAKVLGNGALSGAGSYASAVNHVYERVISGAQGGLPVTAYSQTS